MTVTASKNTGYLVQIPGLTEGCTIEVDFEGFLRTHPANRRTHRFVLQYTHNYVGVRGYEPVGDDVVHYLHKSAGRSTSRGSYGLFKTSITERLVDAKSFATREGAEKYLASHLTHERLVGVNGVSSSYTIVSEIVPADVSILNVYFGKQKVDA